MKRLLTTGLMLAAALAATACSDQKTALNLNSHEPMHLSALKWDELAAANSAAVVTNNGLIMMR
jgi:hypothetical protein